MQISALAVVAGGENALSQKGAQSKRIHYAVVLETTTLFFCVYDAAFEAELPLVAH